MPVFKLSDEQVLDKAHKLKMFYLRHSSNRQYRMPSIEASDIADLLYELVELRLENDGLKEAQRFAIDRIEKIEQKNQKLSQDKRRAERRAEDWYNRSCQYCCCEHPMSWGGWMR